MNKPKPKLPSTKPELGTQLKGNYRMWLGLTPDGRSISMSHKQLIKKQDNPKAKLILNKSNDWEDKNGTRFVRGKFLINEAKRKGWWDLAKRLEAYGFTQ